MLMEQRADGFHFLGSAFMAGDGGYLLTAAHLLDEVEKPVVVHTAQPGIFTSLTADDAATLAVQVVARDEAHNIALLKLENTEVIGLSDDILGSPGTMPEGTYCLTIGVPFGHFRIHNVMVMQTMLSGKLVSPNLTHLLVFDTQVHPGDVGGPLINTEDGRIVGVIQGGFNPLLIQEVEQPDDYHLVSNFSYAVSIEYAIPLLQAEGLVRGGQISSS